MTNTKLNWTAFNPETGLCWLDWSAVRVRVGLKPKALKTAYRIWNGPIMHSGGKSTSTWINNFQNEKKTSTGLTFCYFQKLLNLTVVGLCLVLSPLISWSSHTCLWVFPARLAEISQILFFGCDGAVEVEILEKSPFLIGIPGPVKEK